MKLDLSEIVRTPGMHVKQEIDEPFCPAEFGLDCVSPIKGSIVFTNTGDVLLARGKVGANIRLQCSRCVVDFVVMLTAIIEEQFRLVHMGDQIMAMPLDEEDMIGGMLSDNILDVDELIRQSLLTEVPIQPLCKPDCKGLCPICGQNLSEGECSCHQEIHNSAFQALSILLEEEETED
ncbi:MAG: DUF177 domain-containing protein [Armatimonadota bacterium]|nr:DUF177 domain-containing protein [Armatimonadota bacterium]